MFIANFCELRFFSWCAQYPASPPDTALFPLPEIQNLKTQGEYTQAYISSSLSIKGDQASFSSIQIYHRTLQVPFRSHSQIKKISTVRVWMTQVQEIQVEIWVEGTVRATRLSLQTYKCEKGSYRFYFTVVREKSERFSLQLCSGFFLVVQPYSPVNIVLPLLGTGHRLLTCSTDLECSQTLSGLGCAEMGFSSQLALLAAASIRKADTIVFVLLVQ